MCLQSSFMCVISSFNFVLLSRTSSQEQLDHSLVRVKKNVISGPTYLLSIKRPSSLAEMSARALIRGNTVSKIKLNHSRSPNRYILMRSHPPFLFLFGFSLFDFFRLRIREHYYVIYTFLPLSTHLQLPPVPVLSSTTSRTLLPGS